MKNFKKIAFGLMVGAMALGFSAFTNASKLEHNKFTITYYTLDQSSGLYQRAGTTQPDVMDNCASGATHKCAIGFNADEGATVNPNSLPATPSYQSPSNGWYNN